MMSRSDDKLKARLILKLREMAKRGIKMPNIDRILHNFYSTCDEEVKDSILELVAASEDPILLKSFEATIKAALDSETGFIRATGRLFNCRSWLQVENGWIILKALYCFTKLLNADCLKTNLTVVTRLTSSDLDYTVRRAGIKCLKRVFDTHPDIVMDILRNEIPDEIEFDTGPILKFRRPTVNSLRSLFEARIRRKTQFYQKNLLKRTRKFQNSHDFFSKEFL